MKADGGWTSPWETSSFDVAGIAPARKAAAFAVAVAPPVALALALALHDNTPAPPMLPGNRFSSADSGSHEKSQWYIGEEADLFVLRVSRMSGDVATGVVM